MRKSHKQKVRDKRQETRENGDFFKDGQIMLRMKFVKKLTKNV